MFLLPIVYCQTLDLVWRIDIFIRIPYIYIVISNFDGWIMSWYRKNEQSIIYLYILILIFMTNLFIVAVIKL